MLKLPDVTLVAIADNRKLETRCALERSCSLANFGEVLWLNSKRFSTSCAKTVEVEPIDSGQKYNQFVLTQINEYVATDYYIVCQWDGYVVNPAAWTDDFKQYDYIGALWNDENMKKWINVDEKYRVGNGGFSFRSKKFARIGTQYPFFEYQPEDNLICIKYREWFEQMGVNFARPEIANRFAQDDFGYTDAFGFHGEKNIGVVNKRFK